MKHSEFKMLLALPSRRKLRVRAYQKGGKRALDLAMLLIFMPIYLPLIVVAWCLIRLDGGPGFFGHRRLGHNGREFTCWKLRTMTPNAEGFLRSYLKNNPDAAREWADRYKLDHDPRITGLGRFLRSTRLDELPQFWNVFNNEMSIVGPRPITREEVQKYQGYEWAYFSFLPGITGAWQVYGSKSGGYKERVRLDVSYLIRAGLLYDLWVIVRTFWVVLKKSGQ